MNAGRERGVTDAFVSLATALADGLDPVDLLSGLTADCARLLDVASAGLLLADRRGVLHVLAASSEETRSLEVFQLQREQGPCLDCYRSGAPVSVADLRAETARWPLFVEAATEAGFASVHAVPLRLRDNVLGTMGLFDDATDKIVEKWSLRNPVEALTRSLALNRAAESRQSIGAVEVLMRSVPQDYVPDLLPQSVRELLYPRYFYPSIVEYSQRYEADPRLVQAILDGLGGKATEVLFSIEALLLDQGDDLAILQERGG